LNPMPYPSTYLSNTYFSHRQIKRLGYEASDTVTSSFKMNTVWISTSTYLHTFMTQCLV